MEEVVYLSRPSVTVPWGFRLQGGADFNQRLTVQKVTAGGVAARAQINAGDTLMKIGNADTHKLTHQQACDLISSAKVDLHLTIIRRPFVPTSPLRHDQDLCVGGLVHQSAAPAESASSAWLSSSELVRRASTTLSEAIPMSPKVSRQPPWGKAAESGLRHHETAGQAGRQSLSSSSADSSFYRPSYASQVNQPSSSPLKAVSDVNKSQQLKATKYSTFTSFVPAYNAGSPTKQEPSSLTHITTASSVRPTSAVPVPAEGIQPYGGFQLKALATDSLDGSGDRMHGLDVSKPQQPFVTTHRGRDSVSLGAFPVQQERRLSHPEYDDSQRSPGVNGVRSSPQVNEDPTSAGGRETKTSAVGVPQRTASQSSENGSGGSSTRAYIVQPNGVVAAVQWTDRPVAHDIQHSAVLAALKEEQQQQQQAQSGGAAGPRRRSSGSSKHGLSFKVLQLITGTMEGDEDEADCTSTPQATPPWSHHATSPTGSVFSGSPRDGEVSAYSFASHVGAEPQNDYSDF